MILPLGDGNDHLQRQDTYGIVVDDDRRADFLISAPIVGSKLMSQISPLCTEILAVKNREGREFGIGLVIAK